MSIVRHIGTVGLAGAALACLLWGGRTGAATTDLAAAETQFHKSCGTCHTAEANAPPRQGPNLRGVVGRKAGTLSGFAYSDALKAAGRSGLVWTPDAIDKWITDAGKFIPGVNMMYRQADPAKRHLVIKYLESVSK
jgi:cytochrome c